MEVSTLKILSFFVFHRHDKGKNVFLMIYIRLITLLKKLSVKTFAIITI